MHTYARTCLDVVGSGSSNRKAILTNQVDIRAHTRTETHILGVKELLYSVARSWPKTS